MSVSFVQAKALANASCEDGQVGRLKNEIRALHVSTKYSGPHILSISSVAQIQS